MLSHHKVFTALFLKRIVFKNCLSPFLSVKIFFYEMMVIEYDSCFLSLDGLTWTGEKLACFVGSQIY